MRLSYFPDTDSLYIEFSSEPSSHTVEVSDGVNVDFDGVRWHRGGSISTMGLGRWTSTRWKTISSWTLDRPYKRTRSHA